jgi:hypothetical protein
MGMKNNLAVEVDVVEVPCKGCGLPISEGFLCKLCREVHEAVMQLDERFNRQEGN